MRLVSYLGNYSVLHADCWLFIRASILGLSFRSPNLSRGSIVRTYMIGRQGHCDRAIVLLLFLSSIFFLRPSGGLDYGSRRRIMAQIRARAHTRFLTTRATLSLVSSATTLLEYLECRLSAAFAARLTYFLYLPTRSHDEAVDGDASRLNLTFGFK